MRLMFLFAALLLAGCAGQQLQSEANRLISMSKEDFAAKITIQDDSLSTSAEINTQNGFVEKHGLLGMEYGDQFLRAFIDKETGLTSYQVYDIIYMKDWGYYYGVNYTAPDGLKSVDAIRVRSEVKSCSGNAFAGCILREDVAWSVDRALLDAIAAKYDSSKVVGWKYRVKAQQGEDQDRVITPAEVAALLDAVDAYKARYRLP